MDSGNRGDGDDDDVKGGKKKKKKACKHLIKVFQVCYCSFYPDLCNAWDTSLISNTFLYL